MPAWGTLIENIISRLMAGGMEREAAEVAAKAATRAEARRVIAPTRKAPSATAKAAEERAYAVRRQKATEAAAAARRAGAKVKPKPKTNLAVFPQGVRHVRPAEVAMDPRIEARKGEQPKVNDLDVVLSPSRFAEPDPISIYDLEGRPFITSMSDMSAAGDNILGVEGVPLNMPVSRLGGQDFMFDDPSHVWASEKKPSQDILDMAQVLKTQTGQNPLYLPWTMGPTAIDFAHMPRSVMLQYAASNMGKRGRNELTSDLRHVLPEFTSLDDPESIAVFDEAVGADRAKLNTLLDMYRDRGGIGQGAARLASTDLAQINAPLTGLRNVGMVDASGRIEPSRHPSYRYGIPGEGLGRLSETVGALQLLPDLMAAKGMTDPFAIPLGVQPGVLSPLRSMQMSPYGGVITDDMLRAMEEFGVR